MIASRGDEYRSGFLLIAARPGDLCDCFMETTRIVHPIFEITDNFPKFGYGVNTVVS